MWRYGVTPSRTDPRQRCRVSCRRSYRLWPPRPTPCSRRGCARSSGHDAPSLAASDGTLNAVLSDWELDLFSALARHDLLLARARALGTRRSAHRARPTPAGGRSCAPVRRRRPARAVGHRILPRRARRRCARAVTARPRGGRPPRGASLAIYAATAALAPRTIAWAMRSYISRSIFTWGWRRSRSVFPSRRPRARARDHQPGWPGGSCSAACRASACDPPRPGWCCPPVRSR